MDEGYLTDGHRDSFFCDSVLKLPYYDEAEVKAARENVHLLTSLYARAYRLPGPVAEVTVRGLDSLFLSERMPRKLRMAAPIVSSRTSAPAARSSSSSTDGD